LIGREFIGDAPCTLILGDNIFYGNFDLLNIMQSFENAAQTSLLMDPVGARIFGYPVSDPERYGVVEFDDSGKVLSIEEKPTKPKSRYAVPGLYVYDNSVVQKSIELKPSPRGELEITDINRRYLEEGRLYVKKLGRGIAWFDTGTHASLLEAGNFMYTLESRQGFKIACPEEVAVEQGFIAWPEMRERLMANMPKCPYRDYILKRFDNEMI
jgi:glucose-1-phosphate thymidylyltransferase